MGLTDAYNRILSMKPSKTSLFSVDGKMDTYALVMGPNESLGMETHKETVQFFHVLDGTGVAIIGTERIPIMMHSMFYVPPGTAHNVFAGRDGLKMLTIYSDTTH